jgi:gas vesicle protein
MSSRIYYSNQARLIVQRRTILVALAMLGLGFGLGAILALLFAPAEGEELREQITSALEEGFQRGQSAAEDAANELEAEYPGIRQKLQEAVDKLRSIPAD